MRSYNQNRLWMFLLGLGSMTKVYLGGVIALSELVIFGLAPVILIKNYAEYRKNGVLPMVYLPIFMIVGCFFSCQWNDVPIRPLIKCSMMFYSISAAVVVFYYIMRKSFCGLGSFFSGLLISVIISIFILNPQLITDGRSAELLGQVDLEEQMEGVLFWYPKINRILYLPVQGWYFKTPIVYSALAPIAAALVSILSSVSGRGAAAWGLLACALITYSRRSRRRMYSLGRHILVFAVLGVALAWSIKNLYVYAATKGILGEMAQTKYYAQTHGESSFLRVLMGGRIEFFITIRAVMDNPIIGIGPYAEDKKGYVRDFLLKYGAPEDFDLYLRHRMMFSSQVELIPQHSTLTQFWGQSGIVGLVFCLYFLYLVYLYFRRYAGAVPQWFGYFSLAIPPSVFSLFFNPYTDRVTFPLLIACLLIARAVGQRRLQLPYEMEMEARKYE